MKFVLLLCMFLTSCASTHPNDSYFVDWIDKGTVVGNSKEITAKGLMLSIRHDAKSSNSNFYFYELTFENHSGEWIELKDFQFDFGSREANENINIVAGDKIRFWAEGMKSKASIDAHNKSLTLVSAYLAGSLAMNSDSKTVGQLGALTKLASVGYMSVDNYRIARKTAELQKNFSFNAIEEIFPKDHLLNQNIKVPPQLSIKRWVLFHNPNPLDYMDGKKMTIKFQLNKEQQEARLKL